MYNAGYMYFIGVLGVEESGCGMWFLAQGFCCKIMVGSVGS
jgi:hypothetical protein